MSGQATKITRKIRQGVLEIDAEESSLVVNFTLEMVNMEENGRVLEVLDSKPDRRRIKINTVSPDCNLGDYAIQIVEKCKYIHPSRVEEVEQLLIQLTRIIREKEAKAAASSANSNGQENKSKKKDKDKEKQRENQRNNDSQQQQQQQQQQQSRDNDNQREPSKSKPKVDEGPPASMDCIDDYLELLYQVSGKNATDNDEGLRAQIKGTFMILKLCRTVVNLEILIQNNTVMGALTRVLQEEFKKSAELTFNILRIFLAFSNFLEMHPLMASYSIGILTMKAIEFEFKRSEHRAAERAQLVMNQMEEINQLKQSSQDDNPLPSSSTPSSTTSSSTSPPSASTSITNQLFKLQDKHRQILEKHDQKIKKLEQKQSKILFVGFYILLNLAEDPTIERKMIKRGLIDSLLTALDTRHSEDLLLLILSFLKKLSIYEENKNYLKFKNIILKLSKFIPCSSQPLMAVTLRLLFNLSFDFEIREQCTQHGLVPKLINLLKIPIFRASSLRLLYHLSVEDRCKSMFTYSDGIPLFMGMIINFPQNLLTKELAGLAINVSLNHRNAEIMSSNRGLNHLVDRLLTTRDPLLMKIIRNLSQWSFNNQQSLENPELQYKYRGLWSPHIKNLCKLALECDSHDLLIEILGTIANLTPLDLPINQGFTKIFTDYSLLPLLNKLLIPGMAQNDIILEVIMILSSASSDSSCCKIIMNSNVIPTLYQLWKEKSNDIEIMLQLIYCFYKLLYNEHTQEEVLYGTRVVIDIIECLNHPNAAIRGISDHVVELVLELDRKDNTGELGQLGLQIRKKRFESYNQKWLLEMAQDDEYLSNTNGKNGGSGGGGGGGYDDEYDDGDEGGGGGGGGGGYREDYITRQYVNDEEHEEDMAWRALRTAQQQHQQRDNGYGMSATSPGTLSSDGDGDGDGDDSSTWHGRRQFK